MINVSNKDAHDALIYKDGILDMRHAQHNLKSLGYEYLALPCSCGGSEDDGHQPVCGWGKRLDKQRLSFVLASGLNNQSR